MKELLGDIDEVPKERCMEAYKEEKRKFKWCVYHCKKEVNEEFRTKINQDEWK